PSGRTGIKKAAKSSPIQVLITIYYHTTFLSTSFTTLYLAVQAFLPAIRHCSASMKESATISHILFVEVNLRP
ncbi:MAG: hypothetical protein LBT42_08210, partial [Tannerella sp.]|nr:hypothetical protein [Tannerella sp.]